jgi:AraC-like DNA-binding protein
VDVLSAVLRELRFESAGYRWLELRSPFRVCFDRPGLRGVHIVARGECDLVTVDGGTRRLAAGDLVVLPRGDDHELRSPGTRRARPESGFDLAMRTPGTRLRAGAPAAAAGGDAAEADVVVVCGAFVVREAGHPALRGLPPVLHVPGREGRTPLAPLVAAISAEAFDGGPGSDLVMARLSDALLTQALRHHAVGDHTAGALPPGWLAGLRDPHVAAALGAVHADPARRWTVAALAAEAGLSRAAFAERFTAGVGEPPMRYLLDLRLQQARTLLRDRRLTVAAVASRVGYGSDVAFAAAFRRATGTTPAEYRRRVSAG